MSHPLYVTSPLLPDLDKLQESLSQIWDSRHVTNHGPFHNQLEMRLRDVLVTPSVSLFNNGTQALVAALKMLDLPRGSEVITTPLTFAATAHSISWNGLTPVFADVQSDTMTIDPKAVEMAITERSSAILAVHVYGTVCDLEALADIARRHNLKLIYDAAHAFGVSVNGRGIGSFGDASVFSFHATKLFTTIEGGALTTPNAIDMEKIYMLRNFGIKNEEEVIDIGLNGKMNEIQAAVGLLNLEIYRAEIEKRAVLRRKLDAMLGRYAGIALQVDQAGVTRSEQYYPIQIDPDLFGRSRNEIYDQLKDQNIYARKYFHPICTDFEPYKDFEIVSTLNQPVAEWLKSQVLCLPFHSGVSDEHIEIMKSVFDG